MRDQQANPTPVTVLGLGPMGQALASAFLANNHPTTVWNRSADKADALVARGAVRADTVADAVAASPLVIVCVIDYAAVRAIVAAAGDALTGCTLVNLTADSPDRARELAVWAAEHGVDYLDGTILTPASTIGGPDAVLLYSGPEAVYQAHRSALASLGGSATHLGSDPGRAAAHDVALLDMFWTAVSGIAHGFALARAEGVAATELAPFAQGIAGLLSGVVTGFAQQLDAGEFPGETSTIQSAVAGMTHIIHAAEARGIDTSVLNAARALARQAVDAGHGTDNFARVAHLLHPVP